MKIDPRILAVAKKINKKRAKIVIDHLLKHGFITTEQLKNDYGYSHPPRAIRDVREEGIPLETYNVKGSDGRTIGAYRFGNPDNIESHKLGGRKVFSKAFKKVLIEKYGEKCALTSEKFEERYLQIDHRIPYEVAGGKMGDEHTPEMFMLLSASAQRQKSWSCEHCENFQDLHDASICLGCYWAYPEGYSHIAMKSIREVQIIWSGEEVNEYNAIEARSRKRKQSIQDFIKSVLKKYLSRGQQ